MLGSWTLQVVTWHLKHFWQLAVKAGAPVAKFWRESCWPEAQCRVYSQRLCEGGRMGEASALPPRFLLVLICKLLLLCVVLGDFQYMYV